MPSRFFWAFRFSSAADFVATVLITVVPCCGSGSCDAAPCQNVAKRTASSDVDDAPQDQESRFVTEVFEQSSNGEFSALSSEIFPESRTTQITTPVAPPVTAIIPAQKKPLAFPPPQVVNEPGPWKTLFYENDFSILQQPEHAWLPGEHLKNREGSFLGEDWRVSAGGEIRFRYLQEKNRIRRGPATAEDYTLIRWRNYVDVHYSDWVRVYAEILDGSVYGDQAARQGIDENRWDLTNAFVDFVLFADDETSSVFRYGRQEMLFGRQRLVSPLDWSNSRRTFQGFRYLHKEGDWKLDVFTVNPVSASSGFNDPDIAGTNFDQPNYNVYFSGAYATYTGIENTVFEAYWMWMHNSEPRVGYADGSRHLVGTRAAHLIPVSDGIADDDRIWDLEIEGGYQFGIDIGDRVSAGFATTVIGHTWKRRPWQPRLSGLFYWSSGDIDPNDGIDNTFYTYFPLGHAYWALSDNVSGQNLIDYSLQLDVKPTTKMTAATAVHWMQLASGQDTGYQVNQVPFGTAGNGTGLGSALDIYGVYNFQPWWDLQAGYSWYWFGKYVERTIPRGDCTQFYIQTSLRY
ncbi:hypothetical protein Spb1_30940 [Planctopirus ephydatiae]|uniref:Alginate export domain-containing protein n=1 Tax=Planctopirus ephydatiae TaxID=2528019 RepID=A0A518GRD8_9PLAN|nr:hypothetical protein Spb1_30940 [Planctopirus ephydatiae]